MSERAPSRPVGHTETAVCDTRQPGPGREAAGGQRHPQLLPAGASPAVMWTHHTSQRSWLSKHTQLSPAQSTPARILIKAPGRLSVTPFRPRTALRLQKVSSWSQDRTNQWQRCDWNTVLFVSESVNFTSVSARVKLQNGNNTF